jgi:hypothetical protein
VPIEQVHVFHMPGADQCADLVRRARVALLQTGDTRAPDDSSAVKLVKGLGYVVLGSSEGTLAVYRIRPDNLALRRMKRWPGTLDAPAQS